MLTVECPMSGATSQKRERAETRFGLQGCDREDLEPKGETSRVHSWGTYCLGQRCSMGWRWCYLHCQ